MRLDSSRRLALLFLVVLVPAAITLVWLGVRFVEQDRLLWAQRDRERQEAATDSVVRGLSQMMVDIERRLASSTPAEGLVFMTLDPSGLRVTPTSSLAWVPSSPKLPEAADEIFAAAEKLELRDREPAAALEMYRALGRSSVASVRAGALLRSGRVHRNAGRMDAAVADYRALARLAGVGLIDAPADLIARRSLCGLLAHLERRDELKHEAAALSRDLAAGKWVIGRDVWELTALELGSWQRQTFAASPGAVAMSRAAAWFAEGARGPSGQHVVFAEEESVTLRWLETGNETRAVAISSAALGPSLSAARPYPTEVMNIALLDQDSRPLVARSTRRCHACRVVPRRTRGCHGPLWPVPVLPGRAAPSFFPDAGCWPQGLQRSGFF